MIKCKVEPSHHHLFTRKPTLKKKNCRWLKNVFIENFYRDRFKEIIIVELDIKEDQDRSLSTLGVFRDKAIRRDAMMRYKDKRLYKFQTSKGYQVLDTNGNSVKLGDDDLVSIRFTPLIKNNTAYFALECVLIHPSFLSN